MLNAGERIDEWVVDGPLGSGGTASVYRCHNASAPRIVVALKVLDPAALTRPDARARLAREGEVLHGLEHPGIVRVHATRPEAARPYLVMSLVEGERLSTRIQRVGPQSLDQCLPLLEALTEAVAYLHQRDIQHRDLKPANILLPEADRPVLVDFGLVLEAGASRLTDGGLHMGTVSYVPPEWATPSKIDPVKWDIYSLGAVYWEILVGRRAFPLPDDMAPTAAALEVMTRKRGHPPLDPGPDVPFFLRVLIRDMTHADPAERPKDAGEVLIRLQAGNAGATMDPVDLFRTPMPAWQTEDQAGLGAGRLATSEVPVSPAMVQQGMTSAPGWWTSFTFGAVVGGGAVALILAAGLGWYLGRKGAQLTQPMQVIEAPPRAPTPPAGPSRAPEATPSPTAAPAIGPAPVPTPPVATAAAAPSGSVGAARFGAWLELHPDWAREVAIGDGRADADYLKGWDAEVPSGAATRIPWGAAAAYCEDRGGLAPVDGEPLRWTAGLDQPYMEHRVSDGAPAWRAGDGRSSTVVDPIQTTHATGFRCAEP